MLDNAIKSSSVPRLNENFMVSKYGLRYCDKFALIHEPQEKGRC